MNDLSKRLSWLELPEAAQYLESAIQNPVDEAILLRFVLEKQLRMSVYFPVPVWVTEITKGRGRSSSTPRKDILDLCDLVLEGSAREYVEQLISEKRHRSSRRPPSYLSAHIKKGGRVYKVESSVAPASPLPQKSILAFRRQVLEKFARQHTSQEPSRKTDTRAEKLVSSKDLSPRERNTLLLIIAALLKQAKLEALSSYKAAQSIEATILDMDIGETRSSEAIRGKLDLSREYLRIQPKKHKALS